MSNIIETKFIEEIKELLSSAKERVKTTINAAMSYTYYEIGRRIIVQEQQGKNRAEYGKEVIKQLSLALTKEFGKGYSIYNLILFRRFYLIYSKDQIGESVITQSLNLPKTVDGKMFYLSWIHYVKLIRIANVNERHFMKLKHIKMAGAQENLKDRLILVCTKGSRYHETRKPLWNYLKRAK